MPYLGSTVFVVTLIGSGAVALTAFLLLARAVAPGFVERGRARLARRPLGSTLLGAVVAAGAVLAALLLIAVPHAPVRMLGGLFAVTSIAFTLAGMAAVATRIGEGLASPRDAGREWMATLRGGIVLTLASLLPVVGWFLVFPVAVAAGAGVALQSVAIGLFQRIVPARTDAGAADAPP
jgi:hypothetical protein